LDDFNAQGLANTAWALATVGQSDVQLFTRVAGAVEQQVGNLNSQNLANTAWAFAKIGQFDTKLFMALARVVE